MDKKSLSGESPLQSFTFVAGGLITICLILTQAFISLPVLDPAAFVALLTFAVALPILTGCIFISQLEEQNKKKKLSSREQVALNRRFKMGIKAPTDERMVILFLVGECLAFGGIIAALWHASWIIGVVLLISAFVAGSIYFNYFMGRMIRMNQLGTSDTDGQVSETTRTD